MSMAMQPDLPELAFLRLPASPSRVPDSGCWERDQRQGVASFRASSLTGRFLLHLPARPSHPYLSWCLDVSM